MHASHNVSVRPSHQTISKGPQSHEARFIAVSDRTIDGVSSRQTRRLPLGLFRPRDYDHDLGNIWDPSAKRSVQVVVSTLLSI